MKNMKGTLSLVAGAMLCHTAHAQGVRPYESGLYLAPMLTYTEPSSRRLLDGGLGGNLALGYRTDGVFAVEAAAVYANHDSELDGFGGTDALGGTVSALGFLSESLPGLFAAFGMGYLHVDEQEASRRGYHGLTFEAGLGYLFPLSFGEYEMGLRAEARARHHNGQRFNMTGRADREGLVDGVFSLGLQFPFGSAPPPPTPTPEPVRVVPPAPPPAQCADGRDNDGDGLIDHPDDPGCSSAQDNDEMGECKTPQPGEVISLEGCGTGHNLVLHGVNFDFDEATLTLNAKTILDGVASELARYPQINVSIGGHTDSRGADAYNQRLSERRAEAVVTYLVSKQISASRLTSEGFGEARPVADNRADEGRELNRRVELSIVSGAAGRAASRPVAAARVTPTATPPPPATPISPAAQVSPTPSPTTVGNAAPATDSGADAVDDDLDALFDF